MQPVPNPNRKLVLTFAVVGLLGLVWTVIGIIQGAGDDGLFGVTFGGMAVFLAVILVPMMHSTGKKQVATMTALTKGENLLVHWHFDQDEWTKYMENEHSRGVRQARSVFLWSLGIALILMLVIVWFADAANPTGLAVGAITAAAVSAFLGGLLYWSAKAEYRRNQQGVGEVYVGPTCVYFAGRFYTWEGRMAELTRVVYEPGDPSVVEFNWKYKGGEGSHQSVRVPVPRGREEEAQQLVQSYYAA